VISFQPDRISSTLKIIDIFGISMFALDAGVFLSNMRDNLFWGKDRLKTWCHLRGEAGTVICFEYWRKIRETLDPSAP